jgi:hypothetical protein
MIHHISHAPSTEKDGLSFLSFSLHQVAAVVIPSLVFCFVTEMFSVYGVCKEKNGKAIPVTGHGGP